MVHVVDIRIKELESRLKSQKKIKLSLDQPAKDWLAAAGFNPQVRPPSLFDYLHHCCR